MPESLPPAATDRPIRRAITPRAIAVGLMLIPLNAYWMMLAELRWYQVLSLNPLFVTPVCFLFLGCIINAVIRKWWPERAFSASELATVYIMLAIACTFATHDYIINLMSIMPWAGWYASPENKWESIMWPHLPQWLLVWDEGALKGYYEGGSSIYRVANFLPWILPTTIWIGFVLVSVWIMFCLNVLVRKAWIQETKLSFPVVRLPLALLGQDGAKFYQNKLLWIGFAIPIITSTLSGLNELYPSVPYFETRAKWLHFYTPPWTRLNGMCISLYQIGRASCRERV